MSDRQQVFTYRAVTLIGLPVEFQSPNPLEGMWAIIKADGFLQLVGADGKPCRRVPFHAIADLGYIDPTATAFAQAFSSSMARN